MVVTTTNGTATLTGRYTYDGAVVVVLQSIAVTPAATTLTVGGTQQLTATGTYSNGTTANLTATAVWTSSSPAVTVSATGLATAVSVGGATITASVGAVSGSASVTVGDSTIPTITYTITPTPNAAGWNNTDTTVTFTCSDSSGIASCTAPVVVTADTAGQQVTGTAVDNSGNQATVTATVKLDKTAPQIEYVLPPLDLPRYFGKASTPRDTTIVGRIVDATSGAATATCNGAPAIVEDSTFRCTITLQPGQNLVLADVVDAAGNHGTVSRELTYILDDTPPTIQAVTPPVNAEGWIRGTVAVVSFECEDNVEVAACGSSHYLGDGAGQQVTDTAVDAAGNQASITVTLNVDGTPPLLQIATPDGSLTNAATFTITGTASDATSGVRSIRCGDTPGTIAGGTFLCALQLAEGHHAIRVYAMDAAGNEWSEEITVRRDSTAPELTILSPEDGLTGNQSSVTVEGTVEDSEGIASLTVDGHAATFDDDGRFTAGVSLTEGVNTITVHATDRAGNQSTQTVTVRFFARASLAITSPADLDLLRGDAVNVTGTFGGPVATLRVNGFAATLNGSTFTAATSRSCRAARSSPRPPPHPAARSRRPASTSIATPSRRAHRGDAAIRQRTSPRPRPSSAAWSTTSSSARSTPARCTSPSTACDAKSSPTAPSWSAASPCAGREHAHRRRRRSGRQHDHGRRIA